MKRRKNRDINIFSVSFLDVLANTIGGLAFLLILSVLLAGAIVFKPPKIMTETLPDGYHDHEYNSWLGAREGLGKFAWSFGPGDHPPGLSLDAETGRLSGSPMLDPRDGSERRFEFSVQVEAKTDDASAS